MSLASIELPLGFSLALFGLSHGLYHWIHSSLVEQPTPAGTVMLSALPALVGLQLILAFFAYDIASVPRRPIQRN